VERFMRSFKEEWAWLHRFNSLEEAREVVRNWVAWHDIERPRQALDYKTPQEARKERGKLAARVVQKWGHTIHTSPWSHVYRPKDGIIITVLREKPRFSHSLVGKGLADEALAARARSRPGPQWRWLRSRRGARVEVCAVALR